MRVAALPSYPVERFGSAGVVMDALPPTVGEGSTLVHVARVEAGGTIGRHPAVRSQAFAIVSGTVRVAAADDEREVGAGSVVLWAPGEQHQTWAVTDVVAVVVETDGMFDMASHPGAS